MKNGNIMRYINKILCKIGAHKWEITKWSTYKDRKCRHVSEEGFDRECEYCGETQRLQRPKDYHPTKYIWTNIS